MSLAPGSATGPHSHRWGLPPPLWGYVQYRSVSSPGLPRFPGFLRSIFVCIGTTRTQINPNYPNHLPTSSSRSTF